jgi:hypothetical protein
MYSRRILVISALMFLTVLSVVRPAETNGGKGKILTYEARLNLEQGGRVRVTAILDDRLFLLTTLRNKYKVLRIKIDNTQNITKPIPLSKMADRVEVLSLDPKTSAEIRVPGILSMAERDPQFWDSLGAVAREALVYPTVVPAREEESVFVFIADGALATIPTELIYTIEGLPGVVIRLREPPVAGR